MCAFAAHATYFKLQLEHFCVEKALYFSRFSSPSARRIDVDASLFPRFTRAMTLSCRVYHKSLSLSRSERRKMTSVN